MQSHIDLNTHHDRSSPPSIPDQHQITKLFFICITAYFALQILLRVVLGGALETDEAEMLLMTPGLQWGYGPQLPLYNWLQIALFSTFGTNLFALALLKNSLLGLSYAFTFLGLRSQVPPAQAAFATLSVFLIPDIAWEAQRATTHSNMLLATIGATLCAYLWAIKTNSWRHWTLLGLAVGCGGIAKYNYWVVPLGLVLASLTIPSIRRALLTPRALIVPALAAIIVTGPYLWMARHSDVALSSVSKLDLAEKPAGVLPQGVSLYTQGILVLSALAALVAVALWLTSPRANKAKSADETASALLLRAGVITVLLGALAVWIGGFGHITPRWLLPMVYTIVIGVFLRLYPKLNRRRVMIYAGIIVVFAALVFAGLSYDRYKPNARKDIVFSELAANIEALNLPSDTLIVADFYVGGNLADLRPDWHIRSDLPASAQSDDVADVLLLTRNKNDDLTTLAQRVDWPYAGTANYGETGQIELPAEHTDSTLTLHYLRGAAE